LSRRRPAASIAAVPTSSPYRAVLLDLEGTLVEPSGPVPGAAEAVAALRAAGLHVRVVTNATRRSRAGLRERLRSSGIEVSEEELVTAVAAAAAWCRDAGHSRILPLLLPEACEDLAGLELASSEADGAAGSHAAEGSAAADRAAVDAVVVGDLGPAWSFDALNRAFRCVTNGAALVACQRNRYWKDASGLVLDAGPFVAALEYAAGREAVLVGKPSPLFFAAALEGLDVRPSEAVMVGDDAEADAGGAIAAGLAGWLVRTGKYRPGDESRAAPWPECVLDSVAELPEALGIT
jgi:HAD superfamily hydrolase (TIGR01450 family)